MRPNRWWCFALACACAAMLDAGKAGAAEEGKKTEKANFTISGMS